MLNYIYWKVEKISSSKPKQIQTTKIRRPPMRITNFIKNYPCTIIFIAILLVSISTIIFSSKVHAKATKTANENCTCKEEKCTTIPENTDCTQDSTSTTHCECRNPSSYQICKNKYRYTCEKKKILQMSCCDKDGDCPNNCIDLANSEINICDQCETWRLPCNPITGCDRQYHNQCIFPPTTPPCDKCNYKKQ